MYRLSCYQSVKDKNFESNSQPIDVPKTIVECCYQSVKDKNFESNSQRLKNENAINFVVISLSKIKISKAIHNLIFLPLYCDSVVISLSKIKISKAIHNYSFGYYCL